MMSETDHVLLYFYSAMAPSMAALIVVGGVFAIFRLQEIDNQLNRSFDAFKSFIKYYFIDGQTRKYVNQPGYVDPDINMWLNKDMFSHITSILEAELRTERGRNGAAAQPKSVRVTPAPDLIPGLIDYWLDILNQLDFKISIKRKLVKPTVFIGLIFLLSMIILFLFIPEILINNCIFVWLAFIILIITIFVVVFVIKYIFWAIKGPKHEFINNPYINSNHLQRQKLLDSKIDYFNKFYESILKKTINLSDYI